MCASSAKRLPAVPTVSRISIYDRGRRAHGGYHNHGRVPVANRSIVAETHANGQTIADKSFVRPFELSPGHAPFGRHTYSRHAQTAGKSKRMFGKRGLCLRIPKRYSCAMPQSRETHPNPLHRRQTL